MTSPPRTRRLHSPSCQGHSLPQFTLAIVFCGLFLTLTVVTSSFGDDAPRVLGLERVRKSGQLLYGSDMEGGGPYAYPDPVAAAR